MFIYRQGGKNRFCRLARFVIKCFVRHLGDILIHLHGNIISSRWESRFQSFYRKTRRRCPSGSPQARERLSSDNPDWTAIRLWSTFPISPSIQMDCCVISLGHTASPEFTHAYTAFGFLAVICQNGYLMITGVL